jgi:hypothetical protein
METLPEAGAGAARALLAAKRAATKMLENCMFAVERVV